MKIKEEVLSAETLEQIKKSEEDIKGGRGREINSIKDLL